MMYDIYLGLRADNLCDESRLRYKAEIQQILAQIVVKRARLAEFQSVIAAINADSETAANEHSAACEPLQAELTTLDEQHMQAILAKKPVPKKLTDRRVEILQRIAEENTRLEIRVNANKKSAAKTHAEWERTRNETAQSGALENSLINLASRSLRDQYACLNNRLEWANKRMAHELSLVNLNKSRIDAENNVPNPNRANVATYEKRMTSHKRLVDDATREVSEISKEATAVRQQMLECQD